ncbi:chemotaxis protein CheB [Methanoculleus frigidifontis]|nr:chemotaxis protein CheB [Methanoculleus sp. FWC-SCC1]
MTEKEAKLGEPDPEDGPKKAVAPEEVTAPPEERPFIITGIGASAGGLDALEVFFKHTPPDLGAGYVVVTHMDPEHKSLLPEILQRHTTMPVMQIEQGMQIRPDSVYVIPPNTDLGISGGTFSLEKPSRQRGMRLPIDHFFRWLAQDQDSKAVGILLSGMGHDGVLGLRALKERLGTVLVQDPVTAEFPSMPRSVIVSGLADHIAPADKLPKLLGEYIASYHGIREAKREGREYGKARSKILALIRSRTGEDYSMFKESLVRGRIERRMGLHRIGTIEEYMRYVQEHPREIDILAQEIPTGPNWFFRNADAWGTFRKQALPDLIRSKPDDSTLRVWVSGCATGEQAYSMAIELEEAIASLGRTDEVRYQIFATDIDRDRVVEARDGTYIANIETDVSPERLERFFTKGDNTYQVRPEIREKTVFAQHNILTHPPFLHLDILDVRSLLLYTSPDVVQKLIPLFLYALNPGGILFLGIDYAAPEPPEYFRSIDAAWKIYRRMPTPEGMDIRLELPHAFTAPPAGLQAGEPGTRRGAAEPSVAALAQEWLLEQYAPPAVIVDENGDILYFQGRTGKFLEPHPGKATLNIFAMAREGLHYPLTFALKAAAQEKRVIVREPVSIRINGDEQVIRLTVRPIRRHEGASDLLVVVFEPVQKPVPEHGQPTDNRREERPKEARHSDIEGELAETRARLQHTVEDMQASQEELKSMNEELQSTNEELKSTNEELTSSKEELQSLNEELLTVNAEHQKKIEELSQTNDDMRNLLQSTEIAMLFLDEDLRVRRFTEPVTRIVSLRAGDVGRPITDLMIDIENADLVQDAREVLDTLQMRTKQVRTRDGRWYEMRIVPYRTRENRIEGVVVTFVDITSIKDLEASLRYTRTYAENIIATVREPLVVLDADLRIVSANRSFYTMFRVAPEETEGHLLYDIGNRQWDIPDLRRLLEEILPGQTELEDYEVEHDFPEIGRRTMQLNARQIRSDAGPDLILLAVEDVSERQKPQDAG